MVEKRRLSVFEKYLTLWVLLCIGAGIVLGKLAPEVALKLDAFTVYQVSIPIAMCLFFMGLLPTEWVKMRERSLRTLD